MSADETAEVDPTEEEIAVTIEEAREEILETLDEVRRAAASVENALSEAENASAKIAEILASATKVDAALTEHSTNASESSSSIEADEVAIKKFRAEARADADIVKDLAGKAVKLEENIAENTEKLDELTQQNEQLTRKIESLLPGATSTGLAKAFRDRKLEYKAPRRWWTVFAVVSILLIIPVGLFGEKGFVDLVRLNAITWQSVIEGFLLRLPVAGPLVWLAVYSGRHHFLTSRLEEDYAYKEAVSRAFEGYKREMKEVASSDPARDSLYILCENVLNTIGQSPGRLYDKKHKDFTPLNTLLEALDSGTVDRIAKASGVDGGSVSKVLAAIASMFKR